MNEKYYGQHTKGCNCSDCAFEDSLPTDRTEVEIKRRIAEAEEAEREAIAKKADTWLGTSFSLAAAIRARSNVVK